MPPKGDTQKGKAMSAPSVRSSTSQPAEFVPTSNLKEVSPSPADASRAASSHRTPASSTFTDPIVENEIRQCIERIASKKKISLQDAYGLILQYMSAQSSSHPASSSSAVPSAPAHGVSQSHSRGAAASRDYTGAHAESDEGASRRLSTGAAATQAPSARPGRRSSGHSAHVPPASPVQPSIPGLEAGAGSSAAANVGSQRTAGSVRRRRSLPPAAQEGTPPGPAIPEGLPSPHGAGAGTAQQGSLSAKTSPTGGAEPAAAPAPTALLQRDTDSSAVAGGRLSVTARLAARAGSAAPGAGAGSATAAAGSGGGGATTSASATDGGVPPPAGRQASASQVDLLPGLTKYAVPPPPVRPTPYAVGDRVFGTTHVGKGWPRDYTKSSQAWWEGVVTEVKTVSLGSQHPDHVHKMSKEEQAVELTRYTIKWTTGGKKEGVRAMNLMTETEYGAWLKACEDGEGEEEADTEPEDGAAAASSSASKGGRGKQSKGKRASTSAAADGSKGHAAAAAAAPAATASSQVSAVASSAAVSSAGSQAGRKGAGRGAAVQADQEPAAASRAAAKEGVKPAQARRGSGAGPSALAPVVGHGVSSSGAAPLAAAATTVDSGKSKGPVGKGGRGGKAAAVSLGSPGRGKGHGPANPTAPAPHAGSMSGTSAIAALAPGPYVTVLGCPAVPIARPVPISPVTAAAPSASSPGRGSALGSLVRDPGSLLHHPYAGHLAGRELGLIQDLPSASLVLDMLGLSTQQPGVQLEDALAHVQRLLERVASRHKGPGLKPSRPWQAGNGNGTAAAAAGREEEQGQHGEEVEVEDSSDEEWERLPVGGGSGGGSGGGGEVIDVMDSSSHSALTQGAAAPTLATASSGGKRRRTNSTGRHVVAGAFEGAHSRCKLPASWSIVETQLSKLSFAVQLPLALLGTGREIQLVRMLMEQHRRRQGALGRVGSSPLLLSSSEAVAQGEELPMTLPTAVVTPSDVASAAQKQEQGEQELTADELLLIGLALQGVRGFGMGLEEVDEADEQGQGEGRDVEMTNAARFLNGLPTTPVQPLQDSLLHVAAEEEDRPDLPLLLPVPGQARYPVPYPYPYPDPQLLPAAGTAAYPSPGQNQGPQSSSAPPPAEAAAAVERHVHRCMGGEAMSHGAFLACTAALGAEQARTMLSINMVKAGEYAREAREQVRAAVEPAHFRALAGEASAQGPADVEMDGGLGMPVGHARPGNVAEGVAGAPYREQSQEDNTSPSVVYEDPPYHADDEMGLAVGRGQQGESQIEEDHTGGTGDSSTPRRAPPSGLTSPLSQHNSLASPPSQAQTEAHGEAQVQALVQEEEVTHDVHIEEGQRSQHHHPLDVNGERQGDRTEGEVIDVVSSGPASATTGTIGGSAKRKTGGHAHAGQEAQASGQRVSSRVNKGVSGANGLLKTICEEPVLCGPGGTFLEHKAQPVRLVVLPEVMIAMETHSHMTDWEVIGSLQGTVLHVRSSVVRAALRRLMGGPPSHRNDVGAAEHAMKATDGPDATIVVVAYAAPMYPSDEHFRGSSSSSSSSSAAASGGGGGGEADSGLGTVSAIACPTHMAYTADEVVQELVNKQVRTLQAQALATLQRALREGRTGTGLGSGTGDSAAASLTGAAGVSRLGLTNVGWYHSHPTFTPQPSVTDIYQQAALQRDIGKDLCCPTSSGANASASASAAGGGCVASPPPSILQRLYEARCVSSAEPSSGGSAGVPLPTPYIGAIISPYYADSVPAPSPGGTPSSASQPPPVYTPVSQMHWFHCAETPVGTGAGLPHMPKGGWAGTLESGGTTGEAALGAQGRGEVLPPSDMRVPLPMSLQPLYLPYPPAPPALSPGRAQALVPPVRVGEGEGAGAPSSTAAELVQDRALALAETSLRQFTSINSSSSRSIAPLLPPLDPAKVYSACERVVGQAMRVKEWAAPVQSTAAIAGRAGGSPAAASLEPSLALPTWTTTGGAVVGTAGGGGGSTRKRGRGEEAGEAGGESKHIAAPYSTVVGGSSAVKAPTVPGSSSLLALVSPSPSGPSPRAAAFHVAAVAAASARASSEPAAATPPSSSVPVMASGTGLMSLHTPTEGRPCPVPAPVPVLEPALVPAAGVSDAPPAIVPSEADEQQGGDAKRVRLEPAATTSAPAPDFVWTSCAGSKLTATMLTLQVESAICSLCMGPHWRPSAGRATEQELRAFVQRLSVPPVSMRCEDFIARVQSLQQVQVMQLDPTPLAEDLSAYWVHLGGMPPYTPARPVMVAERGQGQGLAGLGVTVLGPASVPLHTSGPSASGGAPAGAGRLRFKPRTPSQSEPLAPAAVEGNGGRTEPSRIDSSSGSGPSLSTTPSVAMLEGCLPPAAGLGSVPVPPTEGATAPPVHAALVPACALLPPISGSPRPAASSSSSATLLALDAQGLGLTAEGYTYSRALTASVLARDSLCGGSTAASSSSGEKRGGQWCKEGSTPLSACAARTHVHPPTGAVHYNRRALNSLGAVALPPSVQGSHVPMLLSSPCTTTGPGAGAGGSKRRKADPKQSGTQPVLVPIPVVEATAGWPGVYTPALAPVLTAEAAAVGKRTQDILTLLGRAHDARARLPEEDATVSAGSAVPRGTLSLETLLLRPLYTCRVEELQAIAHVRTYEQAALSLQGAVSGAENRGSAWGTYALRARAGLRNTGTRTLDSHIAERGDLLAVTSRALARHLYAQLLLQRYACPEGEGHGSIATCIALFVDVVDYYRCWHRRKGLLEEGHSPAALACAPVASTGGPGGEVGSSHSLDAVPAPVLEGGAAHRGHAAVAGGAGGAVVLADKLIAALRPYVALVPFQGRWVSSPAAAAAQAQGLVWAPPSQVRASFLRDLRGYVTLAWEVGTSRRGVNKNGGGGAQGLAWE